MRTSIKTDTSSPDNKFPKDELTSTKTTQMVSSSSKGTIGQPSQTSAPLAKNTRPMGLWQRLSALPIGQKTQLMTLVMIVSIGGLIGLESKTLVDSLRSQLRHDTQSQLNVIGALVSEDLVNGNVSIVEKTVDAFQEMGYGAVYLHEPSTGKLSMATAFVETELRQADVDLPLTDTSLLRKAVEAKGQSISDRSRIGNRTYTLSAKAIPNSNGEAVAVLVYGDPELALNQIIRKSLGVQLGLSAVITVVVLGVAWAIAQGIIKPIKRLQEVTEAFAQGNYQIRAMETNQDELGHLATTFNKMADNIATNDRQIRQDSELFRFLSELNPPASFDEASLEKWFQRILGEARQLIKADRLLIYRFGSDGLGAIAYESVGVGFGSAFPQQTEAASLQSELIKVYGKESVWVMNNLADQPLKPQHQEFLKKLQVKSNVVIPLLNQGNLFGLLIAHQCSTAQSWEEQEINFLKQLANQIRVTLDQNNLTRQQALESRLSESLKRMTQQMAKVVNQDNLFDLVVRNSREALSTDRVIIYSFDENWKGTVITESVNPAYPKALGAQIADPCFADSYVEKYRQGRVQATPNIYTAGLTTCYLGQLEPFGVKANLVTPILVANKLYGLLIAHHCESPRYWNQADMNFLSQAALQLGIVLERSNLLNEQAVTQELQQQAQEMLEQIQSSKPIKSDEIGAIAGSRQEMVENLRDLITQVQQASLALSSSTDNNALNLESLATEALRQVEDIAQVTQRLDAMGASIETVASNAEQILLTFAQTTSTVETVETTVNQTVEGMNNLRETVVETTQKVENLAEASQQISKAVNLIGRFAAQTHLLALKASIEAARAGEEGRGFAVIADEVRTLAAQSAEATAEIETLVMNIQSETLQVAKAMEMGTEQVTEGSQLVEETRQSLHQIGLMTTQIQQLVESISMAALNQSETSQVVNHLMEEVSAIANHTSSSATDVSHSFEKLLTVAHQLQTSVAAL